jgi:hypothetical protein
MLRIQMFRILQINKYYSKGIFAHFFSLFIFAQLTQAKIPFECHLNVPVIEMAKFKLIIFLLRKKKKLAEGQFFF